MELNNNDFQIIHAKQAKQYSTIFKAEHFICINVGGTKYMTWRKTLEDFPRTLLGNAERRQAYYVDYIDSYFFDRHRECFEAILHYHQSGGKLFRPSNIPMDVFMEEARFFGISEDVLSSLYRMEGYVQPAVTGVSNLFPYFTSPC